MLALAPFLRRVLSGLKQYRIELSGPVVVGLSGGKDSTLLSITLDRLGCDVHPAIVDLGYKSFEANEIAGTARDWGLEPRILDATDVSTVQRLPHAEREQLSRWMSFLADPGEETPCGICSQSKRMLLGMHALESKAHWVALGHHRTDLITTLVKDYFVHVYGSSGQPYEASRFMQLVETAEIDLDLLRNLVERGLAATMGVIAGGVGRARVVRPFYEVSELEIVAAVQSLGLSTHGSGCSHDFFLSGDPAKGTKREIVHTRTRRIEESEPHIADELFAICLTTLDGSGRSRHQPRRERDQLYPSLQRRPQKQTIGVPPGSENDGLAGKPSVDVPPGTLNSVLKQAGLK
jgi:tRNA(Ile)-lysidine synthase TilS/MesJ